MRASLVDTRPDDDFRYQVASRVFYDPQGADGADDSLQNYIQAVSYGQASISGIVFRTVRSADADVTGAAMDWLPSGHGYTHLLAVLPHAFRAHRDAWAWWDVDPRNGITAFATVALFEDPNQTRRQSTGVWAMETLHMVTELGDLYNGSPSTGRTTLWPTPALRVTRAPIRSLRWTSATDVARHQSGTRTYDLHAIGLRQPPPPGRVTAVRVPVVPLEARLEVDQYERRDVSGEGIIVYEDSAPGRHGSVARGRTVSQQRWCLGGGTPSRTPRSLHQGRERARSPW
jgi:hypothetical protein